MEGPRKKAFCKGNFSHLAANITDLNNSGFNLRGISISSMGKKSTKSRAIMVDPHHQCSQLLQSFCSVLLLSWLPSSDFLHGHRRTTAAPNRSHTLLVRRRKKGREGRWAWSLRHLHRPCKELSQKPYPTVSA